MSNMLTNGAMFSTFKRTDSHTVHARPTRKDGVVIYERLFRNVFLEFSGRRRQYPREVSRWILYVLINTTEITRSSQDHELRLTELATLRIDI